MTPRLLDIASKVGVSEATVSRVLNGRPGVSERTRQAVLSAIDRLGYERPAKLRTNSGRMVGLVVPEITNSIFAVFAEELSVRLSNQGFGTMLCVTSPTGGIFTESEYIDLMLERQVSGVIFAGGRYQDTLERSPIYDPLIERKLPVVFMNAGAIGLPFPKIVSDDALAGTLAWSHLNQLGHQRIGVVLGHHGHVPSERKLNAIRRVAERTGQKLPDELVRYADYSLESGQAMGGELLRLGVTGILTASDPLALGTLRAAERLGLGVPDDVSIVGYDDSPLMAYTRPSLTTVRQPTAKMAEATVRALVDLMAGRDVANTERLFDPELILRGSTAAAHPRKQ